jgi:hypothetical protein
MTQQEIIEQTLTYLKEKDSSEEAFNKQAMRLFEYQFRNNLPYQQYCQQKGKTLRSVKTWRDIPAVPINAFKALALSCSDPAAAEDVFMTSGTTKGTRGKHYHPTLAIYNQSMLSNFKDRVMKDVDKIRIGVLFPTEADMPNSSLSHYLALAFREFGTEASSYFVDNKGIQTDQLIEELEQAERTGVSFMLLGATYSFVHLLEELQTRGKSFKLPKGSRILDTGGFKNKSKELALDDFYQQLSGCFGVDREDCLNMYGMTELSTQLYDSGNSSVPSVKSGPYWIRTRVINPLTGEDVARGERGVLVHYDLANFNSVTAILTEDMGIEKEEGFLLLGRVQGTEAKGCSIAVDEFLQAAKGNPV